MKRRWATLALAGAVIGSSVALKPAAPSDLTARVAALETRVSALEATVYGSPSPTTVPTVTPIPQPTPALATPAPAPTPAPTTSLVVRAATPSTALSTLQTWAADSSVDVIDFQCCTYAHFGTLYLKQARTRPLLWKTEPGVIFDGTGVAGTGAIHIATLDGPGTPAAAVGGMTFDFAGSVFQNYTLNSFGLLMTGWVNGIEFDNAKVRNVSGDPTLSHVFYIESDKVHRGSGVTIRNADVVGPSNRSLGSGVQVYAHDTATGTNNVQVIGGTWSNLNRFTYAYSDATGFLMDGVTISSVNVPIEAPALPPLNQISGVVRNTHVTGSGGNRWDSPTLVDGGGNTWQ